MIVVCDIACVELSFYNNKNNSFFFGQQKPNGVNVKIENKSTEYVGTISA